MTTVMNDQFIIVIFWATIVYALHCYAE